MTIKNVCRHCQMSPGGRNHLWSRTRKSILSTQLPCFSVKSLDQVKDVVTLKMGRLNASKWDALRGQRAGEGIL